MIMCNDSLLEKKTTTISSYSKNTNIILPDSLNNHRYINLYFKIKTYASINSVTIDTYALKNLGSIVSIYYMNQADGISAFTITYIDENTISSNSDLTDVLIVMN